MKKSWIGAIVLLLLTETLGAQVPIVPDRQELERPFGRHDVEAFKSPSRVYYPETWFHYIGGNVSHPGITADLEAIAGAGLSGVHLFHGQFGDPWPGVDPQIACLSPLWEDAVRYTAEECRRLGLRFTMQNCPGWAMSGGPWIEPANAMRNLVWSRTDVETTGDIRATLAQPQPSEEDWRDYKDIAVLAFPTPLGDTGESLRPSAVRSNRELAWDQCLSGTLQEALRLSPSKEGDPHWIEISFPEETVVRTLEFPSINSISHPWCYEPGVDILFEAIRPDGERITLLQTDLPQANWQDSYPISWACPEVEGVKKFRLEIRNQHEMALRSIRLFSAARKNSWESEAGWTLRSIERAGSSVVQSPETYLDQRMIYDLSGQMDASGNLSWKAPKAGKWTLLRIGHVNTGMKNAPAPPEGTGWECDKLSERGPNAHFAGYIGRLANGPLKGGLLKGMLLDSWECNTQTWTTEMESEFARVSGYPLRKWLPAVLGYVVEDPETTSRFLLDWRTTLNDLFTNKFYGRMATLARENGLSITYETAAGDVFPADILSYYKYADVPMCEYWQPFSEGFVGSLNFKPIKPAVSAARLYGKPRVAAEAFTSFSLTWDEHWEMLKEVANIHAIEGVTHPVFHTYTHNPRVDSLVPGTSMGSNIGTPFLRKQTWWKYMPEFTGYLARCSYLLERGKPVSDVLWYLGDEMNHKPDQEVPFVDGFKYDYCNPDILLNRLRVQEGRLVTPEGIAYRVLWMPDTQRMLPETLEKIEQLLQAGAVVIGDAPKGLATLAGGDRSQARFDRAVQVIWGDSSEPGVRRIGKGTLLSGVSLEEGLRRLGIAPDVRGGKALWLHRRTEGADWYFVCAPKGEGFHGTIDFHTLGSVELWDPVTGEVRPQESVRKGEYTSVELDLPQAGSCFLVFGASGRSKLASVSSQKKPTIAKELKGTWTLSFPEGWGAPSALRVTELKPWKDLELSEEAKAFSGTVTYSTTFQMDELRPGNTVSLDLGEVDMIASVSLNGKPLRTLWCAPYQVDLGDAVKAGENVLTIEVTGTWFNRLVYDARLPEADRKTWTISGPDKESPLRNSGLLGPVVLRY